MKRATLRSAIAASVTSAVALTARAQVCDLPAVPDATINTTQSRDQMMCQMGLKFPVLPPRLEDPNRPVNAWPVSEANPEGNWTDPLGHTVVRTNFGLWHTYDDSAGADGGAMSGYGDYGPFSKPRYSDIDLLKTRKGQKIRTPEDWWQVRRPEIFRLVQSQFYGKPIDPNIPVSWVVSAETTGTQVVGANSYSYREKTFTGTVDISSYPALRNTPIIRATCRYPAAAGKRYPVVVTYGEGVARFQYLAPYDIGTCSYSPTALQPDSGGGNLSSYLLGLVTNGNWRKPDDPGSLVAWGWGISRLIDRFASDPDIDEDRIGVEGHSRYGKATLVTAAYDDRVVVAWPSDAGAMGTAMMRRHWGESLEFVASSTGEHHWVNGNILRYAGQLKPNKFFPRRLELLEVDAHSTTALLAPRAIFVTNGTDTPPGFGDAWADPRGTFLSGKLASPVWDLLGWKGQIIPPDTVFTSGPGESIGGTPPFNVAFIDGTVGWRRQIEGHTPVPNWPTFAQFAARYLNDNRPVIEPGQSFALGQAADNVVGTIAASDPDDGDAPGSWQVKGGSGIELFDVDADTGEISVRHPLLLDYLHGKAYTLQVMAGDGKRPSFDAEVKITMPGKLHVCHKTLKFDWRRGLYYKHETEYLPRYLVPLHLLHGDALGGCAKN